MRPDPSEPLKLLALDEDDLRVLSAHVQDAVLRVSDMAYRPQEHRFAVILNRFDWLTAEVGCDGDLRRCRCALRVDRVLRAQSRGIELNGATAFAELLALLYDASNPPGGTITLIFAGGGAVRLEVECIEAELCDLGAVWRTRLKPEHQMPEGAAAAGSALRRSD